MKKTGDSLISSIFYVLGKHHLIVLSIVCSIPTLASFPPLLQLLKNVFLTMLDCRGETWMSWMSIQLPGSSVQWKIFLFSVAVMLITLSSFCLLIRHMLLCSCFLSPLLNISCHWKCIYSRRSLCPTTSWLSKHNFLSFDTPPPS